MEAGLWPFAIARLRETAHFNAVAGLDAIADI
jgi:hypothetical protein